MKAAGASPGDANCAPPGSASPNHLISGASPDLYSFPLRNEYRSRFARTQPPEFPGGAGGGARVRLATFRTMALVSGGRIAPMRGGPLRYGRPWTHLDQSNALIEALKLSLTKNSLAYMYLSNIVLGKHSRGLKTGGMAFGVQEDAPLDTGHVRISQTFQWALHRVPVRLTNSQAQQSEELHVQKRVRNDSYRLGSSRRCWPFRLLWRWRRQFDDGRGYDARRHLNARQGHTAGWECSAASWVHDGRRQILLFRTSLDRPTHGRWSDERRTHRDRLDGDDSREDRHVRELRISVAGADSSTMMRTTMSSSFFGLSKMVDLTQTSLTT